MLIYVQHLCISILLINDCILSDAKRKIKTTTTHQPKNLQSAVTVCCHISTDTKQTCAVSNSLSVFRRLLLTLVDAGQHSTVLRGILSKRGNGLNDMN